MPKPLLHPARATILATSLPATPKSVAEARHLVRRALRRALGDGVEADVLDTVLLLTAELTSNAVSCASSPFELRVSCAEQVLRIEVSDTGRGAPTPRNGDGGPYAEHGRGLLLVEALADAWGCIPIAPQGKRVWCAIAL